MNAGASAYQRLLDAETLPVPAALRERGEPVPPTRPVPAERYLSREFHELEKRLLWPRVWQAVCRESEVANPGDWFAWEMAGVPLFVQRDARGELRAFRNACLHRGRQLRGAASPCRGAAGEIRCPFHGFRWELDGSFAGAPCREDFPQIEAAAFALPRLALGTWGGWVFVNLDRGAPPLAEYLGVIPRHFAPWQPERCHKALHIRKVLRCNWKLAHEAFIESYHTVATHPQLLPCTGDVQSQYDAFSDTVSRTMTPMGVGSPHLELEGEAQTVEGWMREQGIDAAVSRELPAGTGAREHLGRFQAQRLSGMYGQDISGVATYAEVLDAILYSVFPNFAPWGGYRPLLNYRFMPWDDRHDQCSMEIMVLMRYPIGAEPPPDCAPVFVDADQRLADAPGVQPGLARVFDQDFANLPLVQRGLAALESGVVRFSTRHESRVRHFHRTLERYLGLADGARIA